LKKSLLAEKRGDVQKKKTTKKVRKVTKKQRPKRNTSRKL